MPASLGKGPTDKGDKISQSKSDRQAAYLYQTRSHCVEEKQKKKELRWLGQPALFVTHSHSPGHERLTDTLEYQLLAGIQAP